MPIYAYLCQQCDHEFDALQRMSDAPLSECPSCHQMSLKKKVTAAAFQLKGNGWYVTDFKDQKKPASSDKKDKVETKTAETSSAESSKTESTQSETTKTETPKAAPSTAKAETSSTTKT